MNKGNLPVIIILVVSIQLAGCLGNNPSDDSSTIVPEEIIRDYFYSLDEGDYANAYNYLMLNDGSFLADNETRFENYIDSSIVNHGRNGELNEFFIVYITRNYQDELKTSKGSLARYWLDYKIKTTLDGDVEYWESNIMVIHFKDEGRWGFPMGDEVEDYHEYPITIMIRTSIFNDDEGSFIKIDNRGNNTLIWQKIQISIDGIPIAIKEFGSDNYLWKDGYSVEDLYTRERNFQIFKYLHDENENIMKFKPGSSHKVTLMRSEDDFVFWESDIQVWTV